MKLQKLFLLAGSLCISMMSASVTADNHGPAKLQIAPGIDAVTVEHKGKKVTISRNSDKDHHIPTMFSKTSRACPPFCIQPAHIAEGVETIAELEMIDYLKKATEDASILVVDSRTPDWVYRGTIPGSVNIPWKKLNIDIENSWDKEPDAPTANDVMAEHFGIKIDGDKIDFSGAKTLVMFCNGAWCGQSSVNIKSLLKKGYPADKIKWYRGGMQSWVTMGLTTIPEMKAE